MLLFPNDRWVAWVRVTRFIVVIACGLVVLGAALPAYAYDELQTPRGVGCPDCHGLESGDTSPTVGTTRKGPHGGYTTGTQKCQTCHTVHAAPAGGVLLLPEATVKDTCFSCHDGTGGKGVYGVLAARGVTPGGNGHRIDTTATIPGGASDGGNRTGAFSTGNLTCSDCHSPHDANTVEPFTGDRARAVADLPLSKDSTISPATNRLLKQQPNSGQYSTTVYGSTWCGSCHVGRLYGSAGVVNHPVETETAGFAYDRVQRLTGFDASTTETGTLGGSNLGYVMPITRTAGQDGHYPICQQCHEDARSVGDVSQGTLSASEAFSVQSTDGTRTADNPRFQVFPHESVNANLLVEENDDLCLNCHIPPGG